MDEPDAYQNVVNEISELDSGQEQARIVTLSMQDIFAEGIQVKKYSYDEAVNTINNLWQSAPSGMTEEQRYSQKLAGPIRVADITWISKRIEKGRKGGPLAALRADLDAREAKKEAAKKAAEEEKAKRRALKKKQTEKVQAPQIEEFKPEEPTQPEPVKQAAPQQIPQEPAPQQQNVAPQVKQNVFESDIKNAAEEINKTAPKGNWFMDQITSHISWKNEQDLVLLNLSVPEQIDELEKIGLGLENNIFNKEQMRIIVEEVVSLKRKLMRNRVAVGSQTELEALRDQRLNAVLEKLGKSMS